MERMNSARIAMGRGAVGGLILGIAIGLFMWLSRVPLGAAGDNTKAAWLLSGLAYLGPTCTAMMILGGLSGFIGGALVPFSTHSVTPPHAQPGRSSSD